jgi:hypothetical protein
MVLAALAVLAVLAVLPAEARRGCFRTGRSLASAANRYMPMVPSEKQSSNSECCHHKVNDASSTST